MRGIRGEFGAAIFGELALDPVDEAAVGEVAKHRQARSDAIGRHAPRNAEHRRAVDEVIAAPHRHADEEILILKEGKLEVTINGAAQTVGAGSIVFIASNDEHGWRNVGDVPATYYVVRVVTEKTPAKS